MKIVVVGLFARQFARVEAAYGGLCELVHVECHRGKGRARKFPAGVDCVVVCSSFVPHCAEERAERDLGPGYERRLVAGGVTAVLREVGKILRKRKG